MGSEQSEVANLLAQIESEYLAAMRGMSGFAATARHAVITARMERMGKLHEHLQTIVGEDATRLVVERLNGITEEKEGL
jgi:hypothetical protein